MLTKINIRDRVKELRRVRASDLVANSKNWRRHPATQRKAMQAVLAEVGYADALLAREDENGRLILIDGHLRARYTKVSASRGKAVRAEPISALYEQGKVHHVGYLRAVSDRSPGLLEDEMCGWVPGMAKSPNRLDALVWALTHLMDRPVTGLSDLILVGTPRPPALQLMRNPARMMF